MKPSERDLPKEDQELLDILVDGEISDPERRDLLRRLDQTPGGWRACALAFLEAKCFRESLAGADMGNGDVEPVASPEVSIARSVPTNRWRHRASGILAMAASVLAALGLGWWAGGLLRPTGSPGVTPTATTNLAANQPQTAGRGTPQSADPVDTRTPSEAPPMMTVALPAWGGDGPVQLPVVERDHLDPSLLYPDAHSAFPAQLREALRRAGYQVRQSRDLLPVPVQDGRHAILPVDQMDIHYVGNHVE
jgi:hypothetical protein